MSPDETARHPAHPASVHARRLDAFVAEESRHAGASKRFSYVRLVLALVTLTVLGFTIEGRVLAMWPGVAMVVAGAIAFVAVVVGHDRIEQARQRAAAHIIVSREALARIGRTWTALPDVAFPASVRDQHTPHDGTTATAIDLDLFGPGSLRVLVGRTATPSGDELLSEWLLAAPGGAGAAPAAIEARQRAVAELAPLVEHREAVLAEALSAGALRRTSATALRVWVEARGGPLASIGMALLPWAIPTAVVALSIAESRGFRVRPLWVVIPAAAWLLRGVCARTVARAFAGSDAISGEVRRYRAIFAAWEGQPLETVRLRQLAAMLTHEGQAASAALTKLGHLIDLADLRWSHLPHALVHSFTGWDVHVACALERWNARHGQYVAGWFEALAELDALATIAGLAHDEPEWAYPVIDSDAASLTGVAVGHPLLSGATRVANDVTVGPPGTVLVITGSNMSGKSTLLRAIGLNVVLAQMGAPVCATALTLPPSRLETSIRVADSLLQGVSYFMAALLRLRDVVAAASASRQALEPRVFYLLDELLQGTNSDERQIAIRHIVAHLARTDAIGALTTHDLHLVPTPEFQAHARHVHFTERISEGSQGTSVDFDYRLRPGPATSRNALALVRMVGLGDVGLDEASP